MQKPVAADEKERGRPQLIRRRPESRLGWRRILPIERRIDLDGGFNSNYNKCNDFRAELEVEGEASN
jgi:hypothetical protein